ncbi:MAG: OsmC family protein [Bacteroidia bacterium]
MNDTHNYEVNLLWNQNTIGLLSSPVLSSNIEVATPPEFPNGVKDIWTPEHLFVASVNACLMATFLAIVENSKMKFISYQSNAIGKVDKIDGKYTVTEISICPKLVIPSSQPEDRIRRVFEMSEKACVISNSIKTKIILDPIISII